MSTETATEPPAATAGETPAVSVRELVFRYSADPDRRPALGGVSFEVRPGEIFGLLGPNGSGKTTLFRNLSTLTRPSAGGLALFDTDVLADPAAARAQLGVVFQSPSLDVKLTVRENLVHHGHLYGIGGADLEPRITTMLAAVGLTERRDDLVETLSGGLKRRVEIAKGLLHGPRILILDEPSTGLDPGARHDLWEWLTRLKAAGVTVLVTTHLMEEAERCDRLLILDRGEAVALGTPDELRREIGGEILSVRCDDPDGLVAWLKAEAGDSIEGEVAVQAGTVRAETAAGLALAGRIAEDWSGRVDATTIGRPTLEDVFIRRTGHRFWTESEEESA